MAFSIHRLSLKNKLIFISLLPILIVSAIFLIASSVSQVFDNRFSLIQQSESMSGIVAKNIGAAVLFNDEDAALNILQSLELEESVHYASAVSASVGMVVEYNPQKKMPVSREEYDSDQFRSNNQGVFSDYIITRQSIELDGSVIGTLTLITSTASIWLLFEKQIILMLILVLLASLVAFMIALKFHRNISDPVIYLRDTVQKISLKSDYSIRVGNHQEADMQGLYQGLNNMLEQIQYRDSELSRSKNDLELLIQLRQTEIEVINRNRIYWLENMAFFLQHELRNKIVGFKSTLDIIERKTTGIDLEKYFLRARSSATLMNHLLESVSDASNFEATLWSESKSLINLSIIIGNQLDECVDSFPLRQFLRHVEVDLRVLGNHARLLQATEKLISNAVQHSSNYSAIEIQLSQVDGYAVFEISNRGDPLPDNLGDMFELFVSTSVNKRKNKGLGLFVVKMIAADHSGKIEVESYNNQNGAKFSLHIPIYNPVIESDLKLVN